MGKRVPFTVPLRKQSAGAASDVLVHDPPPAGYRYAYTLITATNETNAFTSVSFAVGSPDSENAFFKELNPQAGELFRHHQVPIYVEKDDRLAIEFVGCTSGDKLDVLLMGFTEEDING